MTIVHGKMFNKSKPCFTIFSAETTSSTNGSLLIFILCLTLILSLLSNITMVFGLVKTNRELSASKRLFLCLCATDLMTTVFTVPMQIVMILLKNKASCLLIAFQAFLSSFSPTLAVCILLLISFLRYCIILKPDSAYSNGLAIRRILSMMVIFSLSLSAVYIYVSQTLSQLPHGVFLVFCSLFCILVISLNLFLNMKLLIHFKGTSKEHISIYKNKTLHVTNYHNSVTKTLIILSGVMVILYLPMVIIFAGIGLVLLLHTKHLEYYNYFVPWSHTIVVLNTFTNSFVYLCRDQKIAKYFRLILQRHNRRIPLRENESSLRAFDKEMKELDFPKPCHSLIIRDENEL